MEFTSIFIIPIIVDVIASIIVYFIYKWLDEKDE